ncbi:MAG: hypothetical protein H6730_01855 [Deltaproteobacteria bacterium]|nr:hypothetical protein [Deltaproteobacteria bacterium]
MDMRADNKVIKAEEAPAKEFDQPAGWFAFWAFLVPLVAVVVLAMTGVLR